LYSCFSNATLTGTTVNQNSAYLGSNIYRVGYL
jgi:molybdopterin-biosynthesis enzyme MoeA-like protein